LEKNPLNEVVLTRAFSQCSINYSISSPFRPKLPQNTKTSSSDPKIKVNKKQENPTEEIPNNFISSFFIKFFKIKPLEDRISLAKDKDYELIYKIKSEGNILFSMSFTQFILIQIILITSILTFTEYTGKSKFLKSSKNNKEDPFTYLITSLIYSLLALTAIRAIKNRLIFRIYHNKKTATYTSLRLKRGYTFIKEDFKLSDISIKKKVEVSFLTKNIYRMIGDVKINSKSRIISEEDFIIGTQRDLFFNKQQKY
jgi:hypothetical protein